MDALLLAVLNALWQGVVLVALVALGLRAGLRRNATTACVVWTITFAVVALLPAIDLALARPAGAPAAPRTEPLPAAVIAVATRSEQPAQPVGSVPRVDPPLPQRLESVATPLAIVSARLSSSAVRIGGTATALARAWGAGIIAAWALAAGVLLLRLTRAYAAVARMKRAATPLDDPLVLGRLRAANHRRRATVACSPDVDIPCAVGFTRPMILIPARLTSTLDADDLARVVLHESAHLQRYDDWTNALEQLVCALQFFQPALFVARRRIDFEREVACDDRVLEDAGEPLRYAECLARIVQRQVRGHHTAVVPGFVLRRAQVIARVRRIVDRSRDASPHLRRGAAVLAAGVMIASLGIARLQVPLVAPAAASPAQPAGTSDAATATPRANAHVAPTHSAHAPLSVRVAQSTVTVPVASQAASAPHAATAPHAAATPRAAVTPRTAQAANIARSRTPAWLASRAQPPKAAHVSPAPAGTPLAVRVNASTISIKLPVVHVWRVNGGNGSALPHAVIVSNDDPSRVTFVTPSVPGFSYRLETESAPEARVRSGRNDGDLLDAIDEAKYPHPSVDDLIALRNQGVTADYVRRMGALGRTRPSLHDLVVLAAEGVTPDYIGALDERLASPPSMDQVFALRVQGVRASWLDGLAAVGYPKLSAGDATSLAVQGVSVGYVKGLLDAGLRGITPQQLVALRVQGVDGTFVHRLAEHGYRNLSIDELLRLKVSGLQP